MNEIQFTPGDTIWFLLFEIKTQRDIGWRIQKDIVKEIYTMDGNIKVRTKSGHSRLQSECFPTKFQALNYISRDIGKIVNAWLNDPARD